MPSKKELLKNIDWLREQLGDEKDEVKFLRGTYSEKIDDQKEEIKFWIDKYNNTVERIRDELTNARSEACAAAEKCRLYETLLYHSIIDLSGNTTLINKDGKVFKITEWSLTEEMDKVPTINLVGTFVGSWDEGKCYINFPESCKPDGSDA